MYKIILPCILLILCACQDAADRNNKKTSTPGNPILRDYVKVPLDKAKLADKINDRHNRQLDQQVQELDQ